MQLTLSEQLLYATVKVTTTTAGVQRSTGTAFFLRFEIDSKREVTILVTNRHVIDGADRLTAICHLSENEGPSGKFIPCHISLNEGLVFYHPNPSIDLCGIAFGGIINQAIDAGRPIFYRTIDPSIIPLDDDWQYFDAIEEVLMIGCPRGITDEFNNLPVVRRGITATSLTKLYEGRPEFMIDMACFPGSSGSPIYIYINMVFLTERTIHILWGLLGYIWLECFILGQS